MADNVSIDQDGVGGVDFVAATDEIAGNHYQKVKLVDGTADSTAVIPGDATNGLWVNVKALPALGASSALIGKVTLSEGGVDATVRNLAANDALNVAIVDGAGNQVTSFGGSGGTSSTDNSTFTAGTTAGTPMEGFYQSSVSAVTDGRIAAVGIDDQRRVKVTVDASTIDVAHDAADSGNPVLVGMRAQNAFPAAVANSDRARSISDLFGRQLISHIDPAQFIWKQVEATTQQTGTTIWQPTSGKKLAITGYEIGTGGTTAALVTLWFGDNADVTFTQGTDQVLFRGSLTPTSTSTPGVISNLTHPVFCNTANRELHYTTSAGITVYITVYGYEF